MKIAVAGTGYVGLSLAVLLSQHNDVVAVDIVPEKVEKINRWESPIQDDYIEKYLSEHEERGLSLRATTDGASAYSTADYVSFERDYQMNKTEAAVELAKDPSIQGRFFDFIENLIFEHFYTLNGELLVCFLRLTATLLGILLSFQFFPNCCWHTFLWHLNSACSTDFNLVRRECCHA